MSEFVPMYDLESLNEAQRQEYVRQVCKHMGVPDNLNLVMLTYLDEHDGPRRLVAYAKRGAAEIIRNSRGINITGLKQERVGGSIVWTVTAQDSKGRQEMSSGSKWIEGLNGKELDDAIMTAQTRACRRVTLQFVGAGVLDESEVNPSTPIVSQETKFAQVAAAPQPTVEPAEGPGQDVTPEPKLEDITPGKTEVSPEALAAFSAEQEKLRQDAIAQLNAKAREAEPKAGPEPVKRTRKPRASKAIDMGPSEVPAASVSSSIQTTAAAVVTPPPQQPVTAAVAVTPPTATTAAPGSKPRLTLEQMKPFRQRQFKFVNELEDNGFAPKEGMGNQDKLRAFAGMLFPEVTNFNELTVEQWEKYLTTIETKISTVGPKETIKYIEDSIGI